MRFGNPGCLCKYATHWSWSSYPLGPSVWSRSESGHTCLRSDCFLATDSNVTTIASVCNHQGITLHCLVWLTQIISFWLGPSAPQWDSLACPCEALLMTLTCLLLWLLITSSTELSSIYPVLLCTSVFYLSLWVYSQSLATLWSHLGVWPRLPTR